MHLFYEAHPGVKLFLNSDEVDPIHTEFDYTLVNSDSSVVLELGSEEAFVWESIASGKMIPDIIAELSVRSGQFRERMVHHLLKSWEDLGIIKPPISQWKKPRRSLFSRLAWAELRFDSPGRFLTWIYNRVGHFFFSDFGVAVIIGLALTAFVFGVDSYVNGRVVLARDLGFGHLGILFILSLGSLSLHELGHAMAMVWSKAEIIKAGIAFYFGLPVFFVDTTTIWSKPKENRIITASAGIITNLLIISVAACLTIFISDFGFRAILWELVFINLIQISFSIIPFVKMDGYYILVDLLGLPNLNSKSMNEVSQVVHHPRKYQFNRGHSLMLAYGSLSMLTSGLLILYSFHYWYTLIMVNIG